MSATDILIIAGFVIAFAGVRFGLPLVVCWLIGCADRRFTNTSL